MSSLPRGRASPRNPESPRAALDAGEPETWGFALRALLRPAHGTRGCRFQAQSRGQKQGPLGLCPEFWVVPTHV